MKKILLLSVFLWSFHVVFGQVAATVKGELLIQLKVGASPLDVEKEAATEMGILPAVKVQHVVSDYMRIWLFSFNEDEVKKQDMIKMMNILKSVSVAQANHIIEDRNTPDDPFYSQQWFHSQPNDHDIDSDLAWNITTGGRTATGDSIVVCVVETGGTKWDVPDIVENHWTNVLEIPGNGIDDDGNGFIDDYHGWNVSGENDVVFGSGSHGAQVSSMIGAKGNNGLGITGVNWDVKLMQVRMGGVTEGNVIAAYSYPLIMRKMYNETNGEKGAFVVAVNSSWGTDYGQANDAPLWCAMYDSLGTYGVLSCGATTNTNTNVEVMGDLPTTCPSDYLIAVTNTNSNDVKVASAGYGTTSIDLGAPGYQVYLANNSGYGNTGGTSFSSPCVAGSVALLYSAPCSTIMSIAHGSPATAALQMKQYILNGVDQTEALQTQTLSGGRLNVNNSLLSLLELCGSCIPPVSPYVTQVPTTLNYNVHWTAVDEVVTVNLRIRKEGEEEWVEVNEIDADSYTLTNLDACTLYEYQLMSNCTEFGSEWGPILSFESEGCCKHPSDVFISSIESESAFVIWEPVFAATSYKVVVRDEENQLTTIDSIIDPVVFLDFLEPCAAYSVSVYSHCGEEILPPISVVFQTLGCGACLDLTYCSAQGKENTEYIKQVKFGDINHESTAGPAYTFVDNQTTTLVAGQSYPIECYPGFLNNESWNENFRVWIDYNGDGFFHASEIAYESPSPTQTVAQGLISVPIDASVGYVRMRVGMRYAFFSGTMPLACGTWDYGEVEDYCVTIAPAIISVNELQSKTKLIVYPNPADQSISIHLEGVANDKMELLIYDAMGRLVENKAIFSSQTMDVSSLPAGLYSVTVVTDNGKAVSRFIKK